MYLPFLCFCLEMFVYVNLCSFCDFCFKMGFSSVCLGLFKFFVLGIYYFVSFLQMPVCFLRRPRKHKNLDRRGDGKPRGRVGGGETLTTFL